jgi:hypothetical protein
MAAEFQPKFDAVRAWFGAESELNLVEDDMNDVVIGRHFEMIALCYRGAPEACTEATKGLDEVTITLVESLTSRQFALCGMSPELYLRRLSYGLDVVKLRQSYGLIDARYAWNFLLDVVALVADEFSVLLVGSPRTNGVNYTSAGPGQPLTRVEVVCTTQKPGALVHSAQNMEALVAVLSTFLKLGTEWVQSLPVDVPRLVHSVCEVKGAKMTILAVSSILASVEDGSCARFITSVLIPRSYGDTLTRDFFLGLRELATSEVLLRETMYTMEQGYVRLSDASAARPQAPTRPTGL